MGDGEEIEKMRKNTMRWKKPVAVAVAKGRSSYHNMVDFVDEVVCFSGLVL